MECAVNERRAKKKKLSPPFHPVAPLSLSLSKCPRPIRVHFSLQCVCVMFVVAKKKFILRPKLKLTLEKKKKIPSSIIIIIIKITSSSLCSDGTMREKDRKRRVYKW